MDIFKVSDLFSLFKKQLIANPKKKFLFHKKNDNWVGLNYLEINNFVIKLQNFFKKKGIKKYDRIFLMCSNRPEWFVCDIAIQSLGAITVPCFITNNNQDVSFIINDCEPKILIFENDEFYLKNKNFLKKRFLKDILMIQNSKYHLSLNNLHEMSEIRLPKILRKNSSSLIYTSGTLGNPKGALLSHESILHNCEAAFELLKDFNFNNEKFLSFLPLSHSYERMAGLYFPLCINAEIYYCNKMENILKDFNYIKPTIVTSVPRFYENLYKKFNKNFSKSSFLKKYMFDLVTNPRDNEKKLVYFFIKKIFKKKIYNLFGGKLKTFISGGAALDPKINNFFRSLGILILQGYGQTEAGPLISCNNIIKNDPNTVGLPIKGVNVKISSDKEILVKGPNVMKCYWNNKKLTKKTINRGWLHTGDLGEFDHLGRLKIIGRVKELTVTSGGDNISPQKIENYFNRYSEINYTLIYGDYRPYLISIFSLEKNVSIGRVKKIVNEVNKDLNKNERIRNFIISKFQFTLDNDLITPTFKLKKKKIVGLHQKEIDKIYGTL